MRSIISTSALIMGLTAGAALAQEPVTLLYSDTVQDADPRTAILHEAFGACLGDGFVFEPHHGATLFEQGTELNAMQRGNLDMGNLAIFDFQNQVPSTGLLGTPFLFRDYAHMRATYDGDVLAPLEAEIEATAGVKVLAYPYIGARHLGYKGTARKMTPADLAGMVLRMPGGEGWQFVGQAMGATPVPVPFTEVYTALQTGQIEGQDNDSASEARPPRTRAAAGETRGAKASGHARVPHFRRGGSRPGAVRSIRFRRRAVGSRRSR